MAKNRWTKRLKKWHKWPSIIIALFAFLFAFSGVIMNHRDWFSGIALSRNLLPANYTYQNWNLSAIRGGEVLSNDSILVYGNVGAWLTDKDFNSYSDFNAGFPKGIDNRKISSLKKWKGQLIAGTYFGIFRSDSRHCAWEKIPLPISNQRISDLEIKGDTLVILSRNYILKTADLKNFSLHTFAPPPGYERKMGLFNTLWELHSGELFGFIGKLLVDILGFITMFLSVSGILHFFYPKLIRRRKKRSKKYDSLLKTKRINLRWHNVAGYVFVAFLIINTTAGMFLRPPLLIPIMNSKVGIIPGTHLDTPNAWHDKLRKLVWDDENNSYLISTSDGFFQTDVGLSHMRPLKNQPPVSIMGCNVLKKMQNGHVLVGSFSGMFLWHPQSGLVRDYFSGAQYQKPEGMARPVSDHMVAGLVENGAGAKIYFDYNVGAQRLSGNTRFNDMPADVVKSSPISLWNTALEVHTGRVFESIVGLFYMLYVPISGLCLLLVLVSGFLLWYRAFRKPKT